MIDVIATRAINLGREGALTFCVVFNVNFRTAFPTSFLSSSTSFSTPVPSSKRTCDDSELQELGDRLASDNRDALADHRRELEDEAEAHLESERKRLKDEMAGRGEWLTTLLTWWRTYAGTFCTRDPSLPPPTRCSASL